MDTDREGIQNGEGLETGDQGRDQRDGGSAATPPGPEAFVIIGPDYGSVELAELLRAVKGDSSSEWIWIVEYPDEAVVHREFKTLAELREMYGLSPAVLGPMIPEFQPLLKETDMQSQARAATGTKMARRLTQRFYKGYAATLAPTSGEKELARGPRFYMEPNFPSGNPRSKPVMLIMSKKAFARDVVYTEEE